MSLPTILSKPLPKRLRRDGRNFLPKPIYRTIKLDTVRAADLRNMDCRFFCEDCSHFDSGRTKCTLGYRAQHTRIEQMALYNLTGKIAFCRALEID
jgi:hypothetical protein